MKSLSANDYESRKINRLILNFLYLMALRGFQFLLPLITLPYLVRTIGLEKFGHVNFVLSLSMYFGAVIQYGFSVTATREISRFRESPHEVEKIYSRTLSASFVLSLFCILLFFALIFFVNDFRESPEIYIFSIAYVVFQSVFPSWFFQGMERMGYIALLTLCSGVLFLLGLVMFVQQAEDFVFVPLLYAVASMAVFLASFFVIDRSFGVKFTWASTGEIRQALVESRHAFVSQMAPNLYNNTSIFLVGVYAGNVALGGYSAATRVIDAFSSLGAVVANTFLPYLSRDLSAHRRFRFLMILIGAALSVLVWVFSGVLADVLFGRDGSEIALYLKPLSFCVFLLFMIMTFGTNYLMLVGREREVQNINLFVSIAFFGVAMASIPLFGVWGAIGTLLGARFGIALLQWVCFVRCKNELAGEAR